MHVGILVSMICLACSLRWSWRRIEGNWSQRWRQALRALLIPPLLIGFTAIAVLIMGSHGSMLGLSVGWIGYGAALSCLGIAVVTLLVSGWQSWRSLQRIRQAPMIQLQQQSSRLCDTPILFAAQIGFWQPELVVSQGLLDCLPPELLTAVLVHEQAHQHYRDTFWFFWLGWLKTLTRWLPHTESLWQELLLLRELRADRWAAQQVDPLTLAEALLQVVQSPLITVWPQPIGAETATLVCRLEERIQALLSDALTEPQERSFQDFDLWLMAALLPLLTLPLHR